jgi:hypothetical protein
VDGSANIILFVGSISWLLAFGQIFSDRDDLWWDLIAK